MGAWCSTPTGRSACSARKLEGMLNPVHLVLGEETFLAERVTKEIIDSLGPAVEVTTLRAGDVTEGEIAMATSPSLFAEERVVVVKKTEMRSSRSWRRCTWWTRSARETARRG